MVFPAFESGNRVFQMQESPFQDRGNLGNNTEIARKLCGKFHFRTRKSITKFYIKVRKPHFKLRKALFKRGCKNKIILEFDIEKDGGIIFLTKKIC